MLPRHPPRFRLRKKIPAHSGTAVERNNSRAQGISKTAPPSSAYSDDELRSIPNFSGNGAIEDGGVYGVALILATSDIPVGTELFAQGKIAQFGYAGMQSKPFTVNGDEQHSEKSWLYARTEDEGTEVLSPYHVAETVQVSGEYMCNLSVAGNSAMPVLSNCRAAGPSSATGRKRELIYLLIRTRT